MSNQNKILVGTVSLVGKPNVGKSTLINAIFKQKISIISPKPQTTRNQIKAVYNDSQSQIIFMDTPGVHQPRNKLDEFLNAEAKKAINQANIICFLTDLTRPLDKEDKELIFHIKENKKPEAKVFLLIAKAETAKSQDEINQRIEECSKLYDFDDSLMTSGLHSKNIDKLLNLLKISLREDFPLYETDKQGILLDDHFVVSEIVREQCLKHLKQEIPYGIVINIEKEEYDDQKNLYTINATISVEKESQKAIIIGTKGQMIKKIGIGTREELLKIYDCKVNLELFVNVNKDWRNSETKLKEFGYSN